MQYNMKNSQKNNCVNIFKIVGGDTFLKISINLIYLLVFLSFLIKYNI